MSLADLQRLVRRATPHVEDVRTPDRTDIVRKEHGHLTLHEVVNALDALEFAADSFILKMRNLMESADAEAKSTAVHGAFHAISCLQLLCPRLPAPAPSPTEASAEGGTPEEPAEGWQETLAEARSKGAASFKAKDFQGASEQYAAAIRAAPRGHQDLHALHSNCSAALLQLGEAEAALAEARHCVALAPSWPKGRFREGCCLRQLGRFAEAAGAFAEGRALEPNNADWGREMERTELARWGDPAVLTQQLVLQLMPEILGAWVRGGSGDSVLQLQVNAELRALGTPKWRLLREGRSEAKAQVRYAFQGRRDYLANLATNLQRPPADGVATTDIEGRPLSIPEIATFLAGEKAGASGGECASVHIDVRDSSNRMVAVVCRVPCDGNVRSYLGQCKEPAPPKGPIDGVLQLQQQSGFPKALPRLLGFQSFPGDLNFPVIDLERDAPGGTHRS